MGTDFTISPISPILALLYRSRVHDHWALDHPFERLLVETVVAPDPDAVSWINPRLRAGEERKVVTGIPGKTGVVYTLDRETGEFLWATPTVTQNVISDIDGATGTVTENAEVVFRGIGQEVLACPTWLGGKDWEAGAYSPLTLRDPLILPYGINKTKPLLNRRLALESLQGGAL